MAPSRAKCSSVPTGSTRSSRRCVKPSTLRGFGASRLAFSVLQFKQDDPLPLKHSALIYDWNNVAGAEFKPAGRVMLTDESLRDGLQSPSVKDPSIDEKLHILHLMEKRGINFLDWGLPGAGPRAYADVERLAYEIRDSKLKI